MALLKNIRKWFHLKQKQSKKIKTIKRGQREFFKNKKRNKAREDS